jgi:hypothetical protein
MDRKQKVLLMLKPKVKAFGFNKKELQGIAAKIADNLTSDEDASDEDVNAEIEEKIDAVLPYLQVSQSYANRLVEDARKKNDDVEPDDDDDDEPIQRGKRQPGSKPNKNNNDRNDETPAWAKGLVDSVETLRGEIATLKGEKITTSRKSKLAELLKDSGSYGSRILKSFDRMRFETDEEFDDFYSEVEEDLKAYNQERADAGLAALGNPPAAGGGKGIRKEDEPFSDKDIEEMANSF